MKKKIIILSILLFVCVTFLLISNTNKNEVVLSNTSNNIDGLAFYLQSEEGSEEYTSVDTIPSKNDGYIFKEAVCNDNTTVTFNDYTWSLNVSNMENGRVRCKLYFDIDDAIARKYILSQNTVNEGTPDFSESATTNEGIFTAEDDYGTSYYYRGDVDNNYFYFAGYYWRIVRINGDGTLRLIYQGISSTSTGENANAIKSAWNSQIDDNAYIGYMYGIAGSSTYEATHANTNNSTIKTTIDNWYQNNLVDYEEYISTETGFCGDRQLSSGTGIGTSKTTYLPSTRLSNHEPTLKCANEQDLYTLKSASEGNKALTYPIALITADEVAMAGAMTNGVDDGETNKQYYLYTGTTWRTMTPQSYGSYNNANNPKVFGVDGEGILRWFQGSAGAHGVRPVINIKKNVKLAGNGTSTNPYHIVTSEESVSGTMETIITTYYNSSIRNDFDTIYTSTTTKQVFTAPDWKGTSYYFAGNPTDNWVQFGGYYWRIIRVNGDGSTRLIYQGTEPNVTGIKTQLSDLSAFNSEYEGSYYAGLKYTINTQHGVETKSTILEALDKWYASNLNDYTIYIDTNIGFCSDRNMASGNSWRPEGSHYYAAYERLTDNKNPSLQCSSNDILDIPVGLITADELSFAGGVWDITNKNYYLYTGQTNWTMTPWNASGSGHPSVYVAYSNGNLNRWSIETKGGVRPVINLKSDTKFTGAGTIINPYIVS